MRRISILFIVCLIGILLGVWARYNGASIYHQHKEFTKALEKRDSGNLHTVIQNANEVEKKLYWNRLEQEVIDLYSDYETNEITAIQLIDDFQFIISVVNNCGLFVGEEESNALILRMDFDRLMDLALTADANAIEGDISYLIINEDLKREAGNDLEYVGSHEEYASMVALNKCWKKVEKIAPTFKETTQGLEVKQRFEEINEAKKAYYAYLRKVEESETIDLCKQISSIASDEKDQVSEYKKKEAIKYVASAGIKKCETVTQMNDLIDALQKDCNLSDEEIKGIKDNIVVAAMECIEKIALDDSEGMKALQVAFLLELDEKQREQMGICFAELFNTIHMDGALENLKTICSNLYSSNADVYHMMKSHMSLEMGERTTKDYFAYLIQLQVCFPEDATLQQDIQARMAKVITDTETAFEEMYTTGDILNLFHLIQEMEVAFSTNPEYGARLAEVKTGYLNRVKADFEIAVQSYDANVYIENQTVVTELMSIFPEDPDLIQYYEKFHTEAWKNAYAVVLDSMTKEDKGAFLQVEGFDYPIVVLCQGGMLKFMYFSGNQVEVIKEISTCFYNPSHDAQGWKSGYLFQKEDEFLVNTKQVGYTAENGEVNSYQLTIFTLDGAFEDVWYRITHSGRTRTSLLLGEYDIASKTVFNRTDVLEDGDDSKLRMTHTNFFNRGEMVDMLEAEVLKQLLQEQ